jgi:hypothetical protein
MAGMTIPWWLLLIVVTVAYFMLLEVPGYLDRLAKKWADEEKRNSEPKDD